MKEKLWIHVLQEFEYLLENWKNYYSYNTVDKNHGKMIVFCFNSGTADYNDFINVLVQNEVFHFVFRREYSFTKKDKEDSEILRLIINGDADDSHSSESLYYECNKCKNRVRKLHRNHVLANEKFLKKYDLSISNPPNSEIFVSNKLKTVLEQEGIQGLKYVPVNSLKSPSKQIQGFYKVEIEVGIGQVIDPTQLERGDMCKECGFNNKFLRKGLLYFNKPDWGRQDICYTENWFGSIYQGKFMGGKEIIISQKLYRILVNNNIKSFSVEPSFLI
ncbi:hypothetical protein [Paenibacillus sp. PL2-23]|uniref:hypothetical protein n=1 Tax=Paenibacillus sp. PL2-23 TaxID=2100729 RepID=UPI0030F5F743